MPKCTCPGSGCSCAITAGDGLIVTGTGNASAPYSISLASQYIPVTVNAATTVDLSGVTSGAVVDLRLNANVTSLTLPTTPGSRIDLMLRHLSASTTVTWPSIIRWAASVPPVQSTAGGGNIDWISLRNVGDVWVGSAPALNATT